MDRAFLSYYEDELTHIRGLASEFAAMHPTVARNLSLDSVPCPDPYVERLLEGVAFLSARTRLKIDGESTRYVRHLLDGLYPDLSGPGPAMAMARLTPGPQVGAMQDGHIVERGTRLVSSLREGVSTRATYTTAQDVHLWPVEFTTAAYLQDAGALKAAGVTDADARNARSGIRLTLSRRGPGQLDELSLDTLDVYLGGRNRGGPLFDALFGAGISVLARPKSSKGSWTKLSLPGLVGIADGEGLLPRVRASFEGFRLMREYFLMPERFHYARLTGLADTIRTATDSPLEIILVLADTFSDLADLKADDVQLFTTPLVNLFEKECNIVELTARSPATIVHADRTRPRDFEIFRLLRVEDAEREGADARVMPLFAVTQNRGTGLVYSAERRPRRPGEDEIRRGQMRTSYAGDDLFISLARPAGRTQAEEIRQLDIRALCTNRDIPILDDNPRLTLETGDPVGEVTLFGAFKRPRASLSASLPEAAGRETRLDELTWRWIAQLSLNYLSLVEEGKDAEPLRAMLDLYADRGDPALRRHAEAVTGIRSTAVIERLPLAGPICFGHGTKVTLDIDENVLSGGSKLLLSGLLATLFTRHAAINSFVRTSVRLGQKQQETAWPMMPGTRATS